MPIRGKNKIINLLGHNLIEEVAASKAKEFLLQVFPYKISKEDQVLFIKSKTDEARAKILQKYHNPNLYKVSPVRESTKKMMDYLLKFYRFKLLGGVRFNRKDSDGIDRDYYGFPLSMDIDERRAFITGPSNRDDYAKNLGFNSQIDQRRKLKNIEDREKDKVLIRKKYNELRRNKPRELKVDKILSEIQELIKNGKMHYPSNKKNRFPTISTLRRIVNSVEKSAVH